jgi:hypothetical protein
MEVSNGEVHLDLGFVRHGSGFYQIFEILHSAWIQLGMQNRAVLEADQGWKFLC